MQSERKPANFNWVKARGECSLPAVFTQLLLEAQDNVAERNRLLTKTEAEFVLTAEDGTAFTVHRRSMPLIAFALSYDYIAIRWPNKAQDKAILTLSNDCECRLKVGEEELDRWQFLRKFLEPILFAQRD